MAEFVTYHRVTHQRTEHAKGLNELHGVVAGPGGSIVVAESGAGRVLIISGNEMKTAATGLSRPAGIAVAPDGSCYVSESGKGTVAHVNGGFSTAVGELDEPQGLTLSGDDLYLVDAGTRELVCFSTRTRKRSTIATNLLVGSPPGVVPHVLSGIPGLLPGPLTSFARITQSSDRTIYVSADGEGTILAFRRT